MSSTAASVPSLRPLPVDPVPAATPSRSRAHAVARRQLGCDHLADDVVQEAQLALCALGEPPTDATAWLVRAVALRCRQLRRAHGRRRHHEHVASQHCALHDDCDNPLHVTIAHELGEALQRGLADLPAEQRTALELFAFQVADYHGVARHLGVPLGTVRSRLHRARQTLRGALAAHLAG